MPFSLESIIGNTIGDAFQKIVGSFKADPTKALEIQGQLANAQLEIQSKLVDQVSQQLEVNKAEAQSSNWFVAGWRPYIGWICGTALAINFIVNPLLLWGSTMAGHALQPPVMDIKAVIGIVTTLLGFGGYRSLEKIRSIPGSDKLK